MDSSKPPSSEVASPRQLQRKLASGPDLFGKIGGGFRLVAAWMLAPFAAYFSVVGLFSPIVFIGFLAIEGDWSTAWMLLGIGVAHGSVGFLLAWFARRLFVGTTANGTTILPTWIVLAFFYLFLLPLLIGMSGAFAIQAVQYLQIGEFRIAVLLLTAAVGFLAAIPRAMRDSRRLSRKESSKAPIRIDP